MRKRGRSIVTLATLVALAAFVIAADDPFVGTWKLNLAKSKLPPGQAPKSETVITEAQDNGHKTTFDTVDAQGKAARTSVSYKFDAKDYPLTGDPNADSVSCRKIDANTLEYVNKKGGKEVQRGRVTVSKDGRTITAIGSAKDSKGQEVTWVGVYEKQ